MRVASAITDPNTRIQGADQGQDDFVLADAETQEQVMLHRIVRDQRGQRGPDDGDQHRVDEQGLAETAHQHAGFRDEHVSDGKLLEQRPHG